jgi:predicted HD superfamily hydrolase involved in NAD metabolism
MTPPQVPTNADARERLGREVPPDILDHSVRVARLARSLASVHGADPDRAELAGLLHDVADRYSDPELLVLAAEYRIPFSETQQQVPRLLHAQVGAALLHREWASTTGSCSTP